MACKWLSSSYVFTWSFSCVCFCPHLLFLQRPSHTGIVVLQSLNHVQLSVTPRTVALQAPLSMGFSRREFWSGLPCPPPEDLPNPEIKPMSLASPALGGGFFTTEPPGMPRAHLCDFIFTLIISLKALSPYIVAF